MDDSEAASFIEAVKANRSLKELILSNNKIGEAENYNTVFPDYTTGQLFIHETSNYISHIFIRHLFVLYSISPAFVCYLNDLVVD